MKQITHSLSAFPPCRERRIRPIGRIPLSRQTLHTSEKAFPGPLFGLGNAQLSERDFLIRTQCIFSGLESFNNYWHGVQLIRHNSKKRIAPQRFFVTDALMDLEKSCHNNAMRRGSALSFYFHSLALNFVYAHGNRY